MFCTPLSDLSETCKFCIDNSDCRDTSLVEVSLISNINNGVAVELKVKAMMVEEAAGTGTVEVMMKGTAMGSVLLHNVADMNINSSDPFFLCKKKYNQIITNSVSGLRGSYKNKKISSEIIIDSIMNSLDYLDINPEYEISDELISHVEKKYYTIPDQEKESLRRANYNFDKIVSGVITIPSHDTDEQKEYIWEPKICKSYERKKMEWENIQDRVDNIRNRYEEMKIVI